MVRSHRKKTVHHNMETVTQKKIQGVFTALRDTFSWTNPLQAPKLEKIVISTGIGRMRKDAPKIKLIQDRLTRIAGQKPVPKKARMSIASFKLREGETVGYAVTLRGAAMQAFFDRLVNIALPRMRDFRGIPRTSVDVMGNLTIGIPEHTVFPETPDENLQDVFGLSITIVTTTGSAEEALAFLEHLGVPFVRV